MGYVTRLIKQKVIKKRVSGASAERGTRIHELAEPVIVSLIEKGVELKMPRGTAIDEWHEALAYARFCHSLYLNAELLDSDVMYGVELKAKVTDECWGSSDFWLYAAKRLTVVDLKTGKEEVEAKDNTQLLIYAIGVLRSIKVGPVRELEVVIYQPNARSPDDPSSSHTYKLSEFNGHAAKLGRGIAEATVYLDPEMDDATLTARLSGGDHCKWCDALGVCPAAQNHALVTISTGFEPVPVNSPLPDPSALKEHQVSEILKRAPMFSSWLEAVQLRAIELAQKGKTIPGFKVVNRITRRAWSKEHTPAKIAKSLGLKTENILEPVRMLSPSKVELMLKGEAKKRVNRFTFKPVGEPTIAPETDRRQAIENSKINFVPVSYSEED